MLRRVGRQFLLYSFFGWLLEGCYNRLVTGRFQKPNFLYGPVKPMYGVAGVLLTACYRYDRRHFAYTCWLLPLLVEFCSGVWLKRQYHLQYWDYSKEFLQLGGFICLKFALCWVVLAQLVVHWVQPMVDCLLHITARFSGWRTLLQLFWLDCVVTMHQRRQDCLQEGTSR